MAAVRIAGIDYGTVRIGIALADGEVRIATPYENYNRKTVLIDADYFRRLSREEKLGLFVVGLPIHLDGGESQKSIEARSFGDWLGKTTGLPVEFFDERFTTSEAEMHLRVARLTKKQRRERLDKLAAQIMLTAYLESKANGRSTAPPLGLDDH